MEATNSSENIQINLTELPTRIRSPLHFRPRIQKSHNFISRVDVLKQQDVLASALLGQGLYDQDLFQP